MTASGAADFVVRLGAPEGRVEAAAELARAAGAERLVLLVRDPYLGVFLPAPGLPQTLHGGPLWREFIARCGLPGRHHGEVDLSPRARAAATAITVQDLACVFIGGAVAPGTLDALAPLLPLLAAALKAEQQVLLTAVEATEARRAAGRAETLAKALEAARAEQARLNAELTAEHRRKDEFLAMLAHELRNPLAPLTNAVALLRRKVPDAAAEEQLLEIVGRQLNQLTRLIEDLVDVSRVSRGRIELRREPLLLGEALEHALEASRPVLIARGHQVELSLGQEPLPVIADHSRLTQVFANLLHNAAKYTDPGGRIAVRARRDGADAVVSVEDNGIGISAEMLPKVFDLFTQAPTSLARAQGGLGIGLTLVRSLVELHGGKVGVESEGAGRGSRFTVRLPLAQARQAAPPGPVQARPDNAPGPLRVLVVDDNRDAAETLAAMLRAAGGHHVELAYDGAEALRIAGDLDLDLILLDLGLPGLDGFAVAARLRRSLRGRARLVALTGYGSAEDKRRTQESGFDEHLVKPILADTLAAVLARAALHKQAVF